MGKVYVATHQDHRSRVALKTLLHVDGDRILRFKNEFRFVADLCHPNLVPLYELGCHEGLWFITMDYIHGVNFLHWFRPPQTVRALGQESEQHSENEDTEKTRLDREVPTGRVIPPTREAATRSGVELTTSPEAYTSTTPSTDRPTAPASIPLVRSTFEQLARGVHALHCAGLLHLDLKPSNVMVEPSGRVIVLDFGLARLMRERQVSEDGDTIAISGTPAWMPPEQFEGVALSEAADWYAVGLMMYVVLTGVFPFPTTTVATIWFSKQNGGVVPPHQLVTSIPRDLSDLVMRLLDKDAALRPTGPEIIATITEHQSAPVFTRSDNTFVGRAHERSLLSSAVTAAKNGSPVIIHVAGSSGVGKSALLRTFSDELDEQSDTRVFRGRCYERECVPFKAFDGIADALAAELEKAPQDELFSKLPARITDLARVFPSLAKVPAVYKRIQASVGGSSTNSIAELRRRAAEALRRVLHLLSSKHLVVLQIDDLQWADADSAALLLGLLESPLPRGLVIASSFRPEEALANALLNPYFEAVKSLAAAGDLRFTDLLVQPLTELEATALATRTLTKLEIPLASLAQQIALESGGIPFFIEELAHYAASRARSGHQVSMADVSLETVLALRVNALSPVERKLIEVLSVSNSPIPLHVWFATEPVADHGLRTLWSLRGQHFVHSTGSAASDRIELHHDRMREFLVRTLDREQTESIQLRLGRALVPLRASGPWLFDAIRHLSAVSHRLSPQERIETAELALEAARRARSTAAYRLALDCAVRGIALMPNDAFATHYQLALSLHSAAAEAAYLCTAWDQVDHHVSLVCAHSRQSVDKLSVWETKIDTHIAQRQYDDAVNTALDALDELGVTLPRHPTQDEVGAYVQKAMQSLSAIGPNAALRLPVIESPTVSGAMRLQSRIASATYFARPTLFPVLACNGVTLSAAEGVATATPYALAVYAVVLNSIQMFHDAHTWGQVALALLERNGDRAMDARTKHVVHNLVCVFAVSLSSTLDDLRAVVELGQEIGDPEYAAYAGHAYIHNALYASRNLTQLCDEADSFTSFMRNYEQTNALHVHTPFVQTLRCLSGQKIAPATLDGNGLLDGEGFDFASALAAAQTVGSRSAQFLLQWLAGFTAYYFQSPQQAWSHLLAAWPFIDGVASTWHIPMFYQFAAMTIYRMGDELLVPEHRALAAQFESALQKFVDVGADNFAHKMLMIHAERLLSLGEDKQSIELFSRAARLGEEQGFFNDAALCHERLIKTESAQAQEHTSEAIRLYDLWGASAKVRSLR